MSFLLDTDVVIWSLRGRAGAAEWLREHRRDRLSISIISLGELYKGAYRQTDPAAHIASMAPTLARFRVIGLTDNIMHAYAHTYAMLRGQGQIIPDLDLLIAATAMTLELTLVTGNVRHFDRILGLTLEALPQ